MVLIDFLGAGWHMEGDVFHVLFRNASCGRWRCRVANGHVLAGNTDEDLWFDKDGPVRTGVATDDDNAVVVRRHICDGDVTFVINLVCRAVLFHNLWLFRGVRILVGQRIKRGDVLQVGVKRNAVVAIAFTAVYADQIVARLYVLSNQRSGIPSRVNPIVAFCALPAVFLVAGIIIQTDVVNTQVGSWLYVDLQRASTAHRHLIPVVVVFISILIAIAQMARLCLASD